MIFLQGRTNCSYSSILKDRILHVSFWRAVILKNFRRQVKEEEDDGLTSAERANVARSVAAEKAGSRGALDYMHTSFSLAGVQ
jgi:hypothetical protein